MRKRSIVANMAWSIVSMAVSSLINMLILPYVSEKIGIEAYGYISLGNNIISYVDLIAATINVYAIRYISIEYHRGNIDRANQFYSSIMAANMIIALILLLPSTFCITYADRIFDIPGNILSDVKLMFVFMVINYIITITGTVFSSAAFVKDILYKGTRYKAEGNIIKGFLLIALFVLFAPHVWYVSLATIVVSVYVIARNYYLTQKYTPELKITCKMMSGKAVAEVASKGIWNTLSSLGTTLNSGLDLLITNIYLGAYKMGQLSVPKTLSGFIESMLSAVTMSFRPQLLVFYSKEEHQKLVNGFQTSMKFCGLVTCVVFSVFVAVGKQFLQLWLPSQDITLIYCLTVLTFFGDIFTGIVQPLHYGCVLTGKLRIPCTCNLMIGLLNAISMIIMLNLTNWGLYVVTVTTVIGNVAYRFIIMPLYVTHILHIFRKAFYTVIFRYILTCIGIATVAYFFFGRVYVQSWIVLALNGGFVAMFSLIFYMLIMVGRSETRALIINIIKKVKP